MNTLIAIVTWIVFGLIAGAVARFLVPGRQPMSTLQTVGLGIVGSLAGGFIAWIFVGGSPLQPSGFIMSVIGAIAVLALMLYTKKQQGSTRQYS